MYKYNTETQKLVCNTYLELDSVSAVSRKLGMSRWCVSNILELYDLRKRPSGYLPITKEIENKIIDDYLNSNLAEYEIANKYNLSTMSIRNVWQRNNIQPREKIQTKTIANNLTKCDDNYFENIDTPEKAWVLGFIAGDGHLETNYTIAIGLSIRDIYILEKIKKFLKADNDIKFRTTFDKRYQHYHEGCILSIFRKKMYTDLINLGITPNKSYELKTPPIKNELISHFMRGMVCSDGCFHIDTTNYMVFTLVCPVIDILEELQDILFNLFNFKKRKISFRGGCFSLSYYGNLTVRKIFEYLYPDDMGDAYLDRKYNYCKQHFYNLDNGIKSRNVDDPPLDQYSFTTDLRHLQILKSSEITSGLKLPKPRSELEILLGINK